MQILTALPYSYTYNGEGFVECCILPPRDNANHPLDNAPLGVSSVLKKGETDSLIWTFFFFFFFFPGRLGMGRELYIYIPRHKAAFKLWIVWTNAAYLKICSYACSETCKGLVPNSNKTSVISHWWFSSLKVCSSDWDSWAFFLLCGYVIGQSSTAFFASTYAQARFRSSELNVGA